MEEMVGLGGGMVRERRIRIGSLLLHKLSCVEKQDLWTRRWRYEHESQRTVRKIGGNRAFLCKWATHPELGAHKQLRRKVFNVTNFDEVNLYEAAGCMMRLAMWPTDHLWTVVSEELETLLGDQVRDEGGLLRAWGDKNAVQVAAHFGCGDYSYIKKEQYNDACRHDVSLDEPVPAGQVESEEKQRKRSGRARTCLPGLPTCLDHVLESLCIIILSSDRIWQCTNQMHRLRQPSRKLCRVPGTPTAGRYSKSTSTWSI